MAVFDNWTAGNSFTATDEDAVAQAINGSGWLAPCHFATTGSETFTISGGSVTQITGTSLDGGTPAVGDRILIKDAPTATGVGSALSSHPANGVYAITTNSTNLGVARVYEMSNTPPTVYVPGGFVVAVMAGTISAGLTYIITTPSVGTGSFTYGSNNIQWAANGYLIGTGLTLTGSTLALSSTSQSDLSLAASSIQGAIGVLTTSGADVVVNTMSTGQIIAGNGGVPGIVSVSGDVSLSSSGVVTVGAASITLAKLANLAAHSVIGNTTGSSATPTAVSLTTGATASAIALRDANAGLTALYYVPGISTTATGAGTTTLTVGSSQVQQFTGSTTQTVVMPDATTLATGQQYYLTNRSSGVVTVEDNSTATLKAMAAGSQLVLTLISNGSSAGTWDINYTIAGLTGTVTTASVVSANGFAGTVATATSTPAITLSTTITGLLKGNGTAISAASSGTDYAPATSGSAILKGNGSGGFSNAASGTDYAPATATTSALKGDGSGGFSAAVLNDIGTPTGDFSMGSHKITSLTTPTSASDAANKSYVDSIALGLPAKYAAEAGTTGSETFTISSGSVTQITGTAVDGVSPNVSDFILIKDAPASTGVGSANSTQPGNGLYQVTSNTTNLSVSRAADMSGTFSPVGAYVLVSGGTANGGNGWVVTTPSATGSFTYGTNNIQWTQFTGAGTISAGSGLSKSGNTLAIENSGVLLVSHGGTGVATLTGLVKGNGTSVFTAAASGTDYAPATSGSSILKGNGSGGFSSASSGTDYAPATSGSAILKGNGSGGFSSASSGTDYAPATSGTSALKGNGSGGFSNAVLNDVGTATGSYSLGSNAITSLANPSGAQDAATKIYVDSSAYHPSCHLGTTGTETFTISSGTVTQISGTSLDAILVSIGDRILVKDAPASTGTGSVLSSQPGNGIYIVTGNTTNLSVSRVSDMSSGGSSSSPAGSAVIVDGGSANAVTSWKVLSPSSPSVAFTYGTTPIQWTPDINTGNALTRSGNTIQVASMATGTALIGNAGTPTITALTGDVTVGATGTTTIGAATVTLAKMANLAATSVIGNTTGSPATPTAVATTSAGAASSVVMTDANGTIAGNNFTNGWATITTAAGTTTLAIGSAGIQQFTGSSTQTVKLPTTSVTAGMDWFIINTSSGAVTVQSSGANTIVILAGGTAGLFTANANAPTTAGGWDYTYNGVTTASGKVLTVSNSLTLAGTDGNTMTFPSGSDTVVTLGASQTLTSKTLTNPTVTNYLETVNAIGTVTSSSSLNITTGSIQTATLTASTACTFTMPSVTPAGHSFTLLLKQATSTGNGTATFSSVKWNGSGAPTQTATAGTMDIYSFITDGTDWYGSYSQGYTP